MTTLRKKYLRDLTIRGKADRTKESYTSYVAALAKYYNQSPDLLSYEQVADWIFHLIKERKLSSSSVNVAVNAVRFLYGVTLERDTTELFRKIPHMKRETKRAEVYAVSEVEAIILAARYPRERAFLPVVYGCGLRLMEAACLKVTDIDRARMQLRVRHGKGAKERVLPMSPSLLAELDEYWRMARKGHPGEKGPWMFIGATHEVPMNDSTGQCIYYRAVRRSGVRRKGGIHTFRHSFATHLLEGGTELSIVEDLLGHSHLTTTALYLHVTAQRRGQIRSPFDLIAPTLQPSSEA